MIDLVDIDKLEEMVTLIVKDQNGDNMAMSRKRKIESSLEDVLDDILDKEYLDELDDISEVNVNPYAESEDIFPNKKAKATKAVTKVKEKSTTTGVRTTLTRIRREAKKEITALKQKVKELKEKNKELETENQELKDNYNRFDILDFSDKK